MSKRLKAAVVILSVAVALFMIAGGLNVRASSNDDGAYKQLGVYSEVLQRIRNEYVEEPNFNAVRDGALHGLLESLDASSSYLSPEEYKRLKEQHPDKAGIGATVSKRFGFAAIVSVVPGSPAEKNGLVTGDIIESVEGQSTREISLAAVRNLLQGAKGSTVNLSIIHPRKAEPVKLAMQRDDISMPAVQEKLLENTIGYIRPGS